MPNEARNVPALVESEALINSRESSKAFAVIPPPAPRRNIEPTISEAASSFTVAGRFDSSKKTVKCTSGKLRSLTT